MLRSMIFTCSSLWTWGYGPWSSLSSLHELDAALHDLHWHAYMSLMLWAMIFICDSRSTGCCARAAVSMIFTCGDICAWCYALWYFRPFLDELDAVLYDLLSHYMKLMLRSMIFTCSSTWSWGYALSSSLSCLHKLDATGPDLQSHAYMNLMLRAKFFFAIFDDMDAACLHELLATLHDL